MSLAYVGFGGNQGFPEAVYHQLQERLRRSVGIGAVRASGLYRSRAAGGPAGQPDFLNGCLEIATSLRPQHLLLELQSLEREFGRIRTEKWGPRPIDLDLLLFDQEVHRWGACVVPHPRMHYRSFVLAPLAELNPNAWHPILCRPAADLWRRAVDPIATLVVIGGEEADARAAGEAFVARAAGRRWAHCPSDAACITFTQAGGILLAASLPRRSLEALGVDPRCVHLAVRELPLAPDEGDDSPRVLLPAADCRDQPLDHVAQSLEPPRLETESR